MKSLLLSTCLVLLAVPVLAQQSGEESKDLESTLDRLSRDAAKQYVAPVVTGFGTNLNAGWFHRAPMAKMFDFDLEFGVVAMGTLFKDENKTFGTSGVFQFDSSQAHNLTKNINDPFYNSLTSVQKAQIQQQLVNQIRGKDYTVTISGPTIIGSDRDSIKVGFPGAVMTVTDPFGVQRQITVPSTRIPLPVTGLLGEAQFMGKNVIPLAAPQLTIGTIAGSQFTFRYLPEYEVSAELGKTKYFGWGIQHNPMVWFDGEFPIDLSAGFFSQKISAGTIFEAKTTAFGFNASKRLGWGALNLTPYVGYMQEKSTMTFTYDYTLDTPTGKIPQKVVFELEGENKSRLTLGLSVKILFVNVNADYNIGKYNSYSAGIMIII